MAIATQPTPAAYVAVGGRAKRTTRAPVYKQGVATLAHGEKLPVVIRNLSASGCRIEYFQNRRLEGRIRVTEPSIPLQRWGEIVWQGDGASGVSFVEEPDAP
jgi:hypothetical protein